MQNPRKYGKSPYAVAIIHGGPGAAGEMAPVARELSSHNGILQTETTVTGQIGELKAILKKKANPPVILIGYSWGAWLSSLLAARYPELVKKLILVGSGPFEKKYASEIMFDRLNEEERNEAIFLMDALNDGLSGNKVDLMKRFGKLISKADSYDPIEHDDEVIEFRHDIYTKVWEEAAKLRRSGKLLEHVKQIKCPVVAIHGDYDPHPLEGVKLPLSRSLKDFRFIFLEDCGHKPWIERLAKGEFYDILRRELA